MENVAELLEEISLFYPVIEQIREYQVKINVTEQLKLQKNNSWLIWLTAVPESVFVLLRTDSGSTTANSGHQ